jgi:hypothetical protein
MGLRGTRLMNKCLVLQLSFPVAGSPQHCENEGERVLVDIKEMKCFTCWCRVSDVTLYFPYRSEHAHCFPISN